MPTKLDVVVFTRNHARYIEQTLNSILDQRTEFAYAIRIHDDASTDGTADLIRTILGAQDRVPWHLHVAPRHRYAEGIGFFAEFIADSEAEYVAVLDGDDYWTHPAKLQRQVDVLDADPAVVLCHHRVVEQRDGRTVPTQWPPDRYRVPTIPGTSLADRNMLSSSSIVLRRSAFPSPMPAGYDRLRLPDYAMWALTAVHGDIAFVDEPMSVYRRHDSNLYAGLDRRDRVDQDLETRIYVANSVEGELRALWRDGIVAAVLAEADFEELQRELSLARVAMAQLRASTSWRVTAPLRGIGRMLRTGS